LEELVEWEESVGYRRGYGGGDDEAQSVSSLDASKIYLSCIVRNGLMQISVPLL
jgi:hypothetical protein